jgi:hypothetical protein
VDLRGVIPAGGTPMKRWLAVIVLLLALGIALELIGLIEQLT